MVQPWWRKYITWEWALRLKAFCSCRFTLSTSWLHLKMWCFSFLLLPCLLAIMEEYLRSIWSQINSFFWNCFGHSVLVQHYRGTNTSLFTFSKLNVMLCDVYGSVGYVWVYVCTYAPVHVHVYLPVGNNGLCILASALCFCSKEDFCFPHSLLIKIFFVGSEWKFLIMIQLPPQPLQIYSPVSAFCAPSSLTGIDLPADAGFD